MKKTVLFILVLSLGITLNAQEPPADAKTKSAYNEADFLWDKYPWTLGGGAMYDHNSRVDFALGYGVGLERYLFTEYASLGFRVTLHTDFDMITNTEAAINFRAYMPLAKGAWFAQWGFGFAAFVDETRTRNTYIMDLSAGYRVYMGRFYVEPYARIGYPFIVGAGFNVGRQFNF
jgi:hypothetical protein